MARPLHIDTAELDKLKGIGIGRTHDDHLFLILTYKKKTIAERVFPWICWSLVALLFFLYVFVIWLDVAGF